MRNTTLTILWSFNSPQGVICEWMNGNQNISLQWHEVIWIPYRKCASPLKHILSCFCVPLQCLQTLCISICSAIKNKSWTRNRHRQKIQKQSYKCLCDLFLFVIFRKNLFLYYPTPDIGIFLHHPIHCLLLNCSVLLKHTNKTKSQVPKATEVDIFLSNNLFGFLLVLGRWFKLHNESFLNKLIYLTKADTRAMTSNIWKL